MPSWLAVAVTLATAAAVAACDFARLDAVTWAAMSPEEFHRTIQRPGSPVVFEGIFAEWPAREWTLEALRARFADDVLFRFGAAPYPVAERPWSGLDTHASDGVFQCTYASARGRQS